MLNKIIFTILGFGLAFVFFPHQSHDSNKRAGVSGIATQKAEAHPENAAPEMALNLSAPILSSKAAVGYDLNSGTILYSKNLDDKLPIASLTKLMTALVVINRTQPEDEVVINKNSLLGIGNTVGLVEGEKIQVISLLKAMLIPSGNDAALALADYVAGSNEKFAQMMNDEAKKLNLVATNFSNPAGWDYWDKQENFSNALDLLKVTQEVLKHNELAEIVKTRETAVTSLDNKYVHRLKSTNQLLLDDPKVEGVKTGFTSKALGNLITLYNHNGNYILTVVLNSDNREEDSQKLLDWILNVYRW